MTARTQSFEQSTFGFKSERNSSTATLNASATFTGLSETFASNEVFISIKTDQAGTVFLDFSDDEGVTFETKSFAVAANSHREIHEFKAARRFRVRFTNTSASNQTSFSLNTYYGQFDSSSSAVGRDYFTDVNRGNIPGTSMVGKVAQNDQIGQTFTDVWMNTTNLVYPTANETWELVSDNANDTSAGSGARTILVNYLDEDYVEQSQVVTMNGVTPVALTGGDQFRNAGFFIASAGGTNQDSVSTGKITLRVASAGATRGVMSAGNTGDFGSHFCVPAGKTALYIQTSIFAPKNEDITVRTRFRIGETGPFLIGGTANVYQASLIFPFKAGLLLPEKSEFVHQAKTVNIAPITGTVVNEFILFDN